MTALMCRRPGLVDAGDPQPPPSLEVTVMPRPARLIAAVVCLSIGCSASASVTGASATEAPTRSCTRATARSCGC